MNTTVFYKSLAVTAVFHVLGQLAAKIPDVPTSPLQTLFATAVAILLHTLMLYWVFR